MTRYIGMIILWIVSWAAQAQTGFIQNPDFDDRISSLIDFSIPVISVENLQDIRDNVWILDVREIFEYEVSHIENAIFLGSKDFDHPDFSGIDKENDTIVLYCSIGYRSEKTGEELKRKGFKKVYNLYGSIFEWANRGYPLVNERGRETNKLHVYNRTWSVWITNPNIKKVW